MKIFEDMINKNLENFDKLFKPKKVKFNPDIKKLSEAYGGIELSDVVNNLKDGRSSSFWLELTATKIYNLQPVSNKNALYDASIKIQESRLLEEILVGTKTLSKNGLDLMQSGFKGRGFKDISKEDKMRALCTSLALVDYHIIVDTIDSPIILFIPIKTIKFLLKRSERKLPLVYNRKTFYKDFFDKSVEELLENNEFEEII